MASRSRLAIKVSGLDETAMEAARQRQNQLTKPPGSLGRLEELSIQLAGITGQPQPTVEHKAIVVMAGDHGVTAEGVSAYPAEVTPQMVLNFLRGGAAINVIARQVGARVVVVDMGVAAEFEPHPELIDRKIAAGTANMARGPAMSDEQAETALAVGMEIAADLAGQGLQLIGTGEMGIGNTTPSSAITAVLTGAPVAEVVGDRMLLSFILNFTVILFTWAVAFPIGAYAATHQYSWGDYGLTLLGYVGLATPNFLFALVLMYFANVEFGLAIGGIMDPEYLDKPWSWAKFGSVLNHLWIPVIVIGTSGTAGMIRRLRANLLDELQKQYVVTARAKGMPPFGLLVKYPLRMALNPFIADIGNLLPSVISGSAIVAVVLSLQTSGPMLLDALRSQDQYLAGSFLMFLALLTVIGMFISDLLLAVLDPRIRLEEAG